MRISRIALSKYCKERLGSPLATLRLLGHGFHSDAYLATLLDGRCFVLKELRPTLGHDYPSDRAQVFFCAHHAYGKLPSHRRSIDVIGVTPRRYTSLGACSDFLHALEPIPKGYECYANDFVCILKNGVATPLDVARARACARYLARLHRVRWRGSGQQRDSLYRRKLRDTIGHGECMMGVLDTYPQRVAFATWRELGEVVKRSIDWWLSLRDRAHRLCRIHGDFWQGNIYFNGQRLLVSDRSRGEWGDAADDVASLSINYLWHALMQRGAWDGPFKDLFNAFVGEYLRRTRDEELFEVLAPFYAFRAIVIANPVFYPRVSNSVRRILLKFALNVLKAKHCAPERIADHLKP